MDISNNNDVSDVIDVSDVSDNNDVSNNSDNNDLGEFELFNNNNDFDLLMDNMFDNFELGNIVHGNKNISDRLGIRTSRLDDKVKSYMTSVIRDSKIDAYKERKLSI